MVLIGVNAPFLSFFLSRSSVGGRRFNSIGRTRQLSLPHLRRRLGRSRRVLVQSTLCAVGYIQITPLTDAWHWHGGSGTHRGERSRAANAFAQVRLPREAGSSSSSNATHERAPSSPPAPSRRPRGSDPRGQRSIVKGTNENGWAGLPGDVDPRPQLQGPSRTVAIGRGGCCRRDKRTA